MYLSMTPGKALMVQLIGTHIGVLFFSELGFTFNENYAEYNNNKDQRRMELPYSVSMLNVLCFTLIRRI